MKVNVELKWSHKYGIVGWRQTELWNYKLIFQNSRKSPNFFLAFRPPHKHLASAHWLIAAHPTYTVPKTVTYISSLHEPKRSKNFQERIWRLMTIPAHTLSRRLLIPGHQLFSMLSRVLMACGRLNLSGRLLRGVDCKQIAGLNSPLGRDIFRPECYISPTKVWKHARAKLGHNYH